MPGNQKKQKHNQCSHCDRQRPINFAPPPWELRNRGRGSLGRRRGGTAGNQGGRQSLRSQGRGSDNGGRKPNKTNVFADPVCCVGSARQVNKLTQEWIAHWTEHEEDTSLTLAFQTCAILNFTMLKGCDELMASRRVCCLDSTVVWQCLGCLGQSELRAPDGFDS